MIAYEKPEHERTTQTITRQRRMFQTIAGMGRKKQTRSSLIHIPIPIARSAIIALGFPFFLTIGFFSIASCFCSILGFCDNGERMDCHCKRVI